MARFCWQIHPTHYYINYVNLLSMTIKQIYSEICEGVDFREKESELRRHKVIS